LLHLKSVCMSHLNVTGFYFATFKISVHVTLKCDRFLLFYIKNQRACHISVLLHTKLVCMRHEVIKGIKCGTCGELCVTYDYYYIAMSGVCILPLIKCTCITVS
jgi:hypothetical protein